MKETQRSPAARPAPTGEGRSGRAGLLLPTLFLLLIPNLLQVRVAFFGDERWDRRERDRRMDAANTLALLCLPGALFCIASLVTEGARRGPGAPAGHPQLVGLGRLLLLSVVLGGLFVVDVVVGFFLTFGVPYLGLLMTLGLGFLSVVGAGDILLDLWGFQSRTSGVLRWIGTAAFVFMVVCWDLCAMYLALSAAC